jgi:hypothetical protein
MARPAYSVLFGHLGLAAGGTDVFTVPPGFVYVLRDVDFYQHQVAGAAVVRMSESVGNAYFFAGGMPAFTFSWLQWQGRQVFEAGETLQGWADLTNVWGRFSGYVLIA